MKYTFLPLSALLLALVAGGCAKEEKNVIVKSKKSAGSGGEAAPESTTPAPAPGDGTAPSPESEASKSADGSSPTDPSKTDPSNPPQSNPQPPVAKKNPTKYPDAIVEHACNNHADRLIETFRKYYNPLAEKGEQLHADNLKVLTKLKEIIENDPANLTAVKATAGYEKYSDDERYLAIMNGFIAPYLASDHVPVAYRARQCLSKKDLALNDRFNKQGCEKKQEPISLPYTPMMARDAIAFVDDVTKEVGLRMCAMGLIKLTYEEYNESPFSYRSEYSGPNGSHDYFYNPIFVCSELVFTKNGPKLTNEKFLDATRNKYAFEYFLDMHGYWFVSRQSERANVKKPDYLMGLDKFVEKRQLDICKQTQGF